MPNARYEWIMAYQFLPEYPSEQSWQAAFTEFKRALLARDSIGYESLG
jgi:hypothetical protein